MATFDLTREPWIPVERAEGTSEEVSLRTVLTKAHRIREIFGYSPPQTAALYRLLQALTLRIDGLAPKDQRAWARQYEENDRFDAEAIRRYFDKWQDEKERFDLLHPERPFYQKPDPPTPNKGSLGWIVHDRARGNMATLFDHTLDEHNPPLSLPEAARALVTIQLYGLSGLAGPGRPNYREGPLVKGTVFWIRAPNLRDALLLNTPPLEEETRMGKSGKPIWERDQLPEREKRPSEGYADYLTWQSRFIYLQTSVNEGGTVEVTGAEISHAVELEEPPMGDPLMAHVRDEESGITPLKMSKGRALWRDANAFMSVFSEETGGSPRTVQWVASHLPEARWWVDAFGLIKDPERVSKPIEWRHARVPVYSTVIGSGVHENILQEALDHAERQAGILRRAAREYAAYLQYSCGYDDLELENQRRDVRELARSSGALRQYWSRLEDPFFSWLEDLSGAEGRIDVLQAEWTKAAYVRANRAYEEALGTLGETAKHMRARVAGKERLQPAAAFADVLEEQPA